MESPIASAQTHATLEKSVKYVRKQPPPLPSSPDSSPAPLAHVTVVTLTRERRTSSVVRKIAHAIVLPDEPEESLPADADQEELDYGYEHER